ncbi:MAG: GrpB family protein [Mycobacteriales bacterium]
MLALVDRYELCPALFPALVEVGWQLAPEPADEADRRWSLCYPDVAYRTHHLHVIEYGSVGWPALLAFRDHLRRDAADVAAYAAVKRQLAAVDDTDRVRYRAGKAPFIRSVLDRLARD